MFGRSKNSLPPKPKKLHSLEYLKYLHIVLKRNCDATDYNSEEVVESLRLFSEILVWGDQNDGAIMDFFWEQNALELLIRYIGKHQDRDICIQLLQTLNILFENLTNNRAIYYLLSQNHINGIILHDFDFTDEEVIGYFIAFLKSLSFRVNGETINFFYDEAQASFPLYQRALKFFNHPETMVRIAVRTISLNIFKVDHVACSMHVYAYTSVPYFSHLTDEMRKTASLINDSVCFRTRLRGSIEDLVAEQYDHLHYIDDIFALGISDLTGVLFLILLQRIFLPLYVNSLTKRHPPNPHESRESSRGAFPFFFHTVAMFLLSQVFTILHQPDLIRVLTEAIFVGDLALLGPSSRALATTNDEADASPLDNCVIAHLRAAHHGKREAKAASPGTRLAAFLRTSAECGCDIGVTGGYCNGGGDIDASLERCNREIRNFPGGNNKTAMNNDQSSSAPATDASPESSITRQISVSPTVPNPPQLAPEKDTNEDDHPEEKPRFCLSGKPFLRSLFRSLEVGPGTDYDTFFALSLLISIKQNGGLDEETLALALLQTPTEESPCNPMLITKLLDIISDAAKMGSRVRCATLNLALFLLVLVTRDSSRRCLLTENQRLQAQNAFEESRTLLQNLFMTEPDFADIFECEVSRYRAQKLTPPQLLENASFLVNHAADALKLSSNRSEDNLAASASPSANGGSPQLCRAVEPHPPPPYTALPITELEHIQRAVAIFLCLHGYLSTYIFQRESGVAENQLNELTVPQLERLPALSSFGNIPTAGKVVVAVADSIDIAKHQIFCCEIEHLSGRIEKRYLIVSDVQLILVEPSPRRIGWGTVKFAGLLQDIELKKDSSNTHTLKAVVYKAGERATLTLRRIVAESSGAKVVSSSDLVTAVPLMDAKLRFQNTLQCSTICNMITHQTRKIRTAKLARLQGLLSISDLKSTRPSDPRSGVIPSSANKLKTAGSAPTPLLWKTVSPPSSPKTNSLRANSPDKRTDRSPPGQSIAMVELSKKTTSSETTPTSHPPAK